MRLLGRRIAKHGAADPKVTEARNTLAMFAAAAEKSHSDPTVSNARIDALLRTFFAANIDVAAIQSSIPEPP